MRDVLYLELATAGRHRSLEEASLDYQRLWGDWNAWREEEVAYDRSALYAEFGRIVGMSLGYHLGDGVQEEFRISSWVGDEVAILGEFLRVVDSLSKAKSGLRICSHNGKSFDFPYLAKRLVANGLAIPPVMNIAGMKPWALPHLDTLELWRHGAGRRSYVGLELLALTLGIDLPYAWMEGRDVHSRFWSGEREEWERIGRQGGLEVYLTAQVLRRLEGQAPIDRQKVRMRLRIMDDDSAKCA